MELKIIDHKHLKKIFLNYLVICLLIAVGGFVLYRSGFQLFRGSAWVAAMKNLLLSLMIGFALVYTYFQVSQRKKLQSLPTLEEKIPFYENFFRNRCWWHVFSCLVSAFLLLITARMIFFYFGLFDLLGMLLSYPSQMMIRKEMQEQDLLFIK